MRSGNAWNLEIRKQNCDDEVALLEIRALDVSRKINKPHHPVCSNINTWLIPCLHCSFISANIFYTASFPPYSSVHDAHCNTFSTICLDRVQFQNMFRSPPLQSLMLGGMCLSNLNLSYKAPSWWLKYGNRDVPCTDRSKQERGIFIKSRLKLRDRLKLCILADTFRNEAVGDGHGQLLLE